MYAADGSGIRLTDAGRCLVGILSSKRTRNPGRPEASTDREVRELADAGWIVDTRPTPGTIAVAGGGPFARAIAAALSACGHSCAVLDASTGRHWTELTPASVDLVVVASACCLPDPAVTSFIQALNLPHVLVSSLGGGALLGPLVVPGHGPCRRCADLWIADQDARWPSAVLELARVSAEPTARIVRWAASTLALEIAWWLRSGSSSLIGALVSVDPWRPGVRTRLVDPHPDCCGTPQLRAVA